MMTAAEALPAPNLNYLYMLHDAIGVNTDLFQVEGLDPKPYNLARELAKRVTSNKNKDATVLFVGDKGLGKSEAATGLAEGVMQEIHKVQSERTLDDIFNWQRDISVIDPVNTLKCLNAKRPKSSVVLLDDMSISMDSRKHQSKENIESSEVWITMRTLRQVVIGTTVSGSLIDKRARENFTYVIKMLDDTRYDDLFEPGRGVRFGDMRGVYKDSLSDAIKFPRIKLHENYNHIVLSRIMCFPPSKNLLDYYNEYRINEAERLRQKKQQAHDTKDTPLAQEYQSTTAYDFFKKYRSEHPQNNNDKSAYIDEIWNATKNNGFNVGRTTIVTYMSRR